MTATALVWIAVALVGGTGAILRFVLDDAVQGRLAGEFPFGTLAVNGLGSFLLGLLHGAGVTGDQLLLAGTALLGSFTTFSTWMLETERLAEDGGAGLSLTNVFGSLAVGLAAVALGWVIGAAG
ncbi:MAG: fluoride efflux transporter CrcB [Actinomycetota bacterium]|nr:fluoride efflux transporter CrcB [Actinomycetota bacterium]